MGKDRITVTLEHDLVKEIDRTAKHLNKSRSYMVEEAIRTWKTVGLQRALKDGYLAMAEEDRATAEDSLAAGFEALK